MEVLVFLVNSMVFLIIGLEIDVTELRPNLGDVGIAIGAVMVGRVVVVYGLGFLHRLVQPTRRISLPYRHVQYWGGLRGAISLALALTLAEAGFDQGVVDSVLLMTFGVVLFTLLIQGTSIGTLIDRLSLAGVAHHEHEQQIRQARIFALRSGQAEVERLGRSGVLFRNMSDAMVSTYDDQILEAQASLGGLIGEHPELEISMLLAARRDAIVAERAAVTDLARRGLISESVSHSLVIEFNNRLAALELIEERWESADEPGGFRDE